MSTTYFEPEGSSSARRLYIYSYGMTRVTCISTNSLVGRRDIRRPEYEPSGSKLLEDIKNVKIKIRI